MPAQQQIFDIPVGRHYFFPPVQTLVTLINHRVAAT
jgi:hypothetical protein